MKKAPPQFFHLDGPKPVPKGVAERNALLALLLEKFDSTKYPILCNVGMRSPNGKNVFADLILVLPGGVFVIDSVFRTCSISVPSPLEQWKLTYRNGKHFMDSPLVELGTVVEILSERTGLPASAFRAIVSFSPITVFSCNMPEGVMHRDEVPDYIQKHAGTELFPEAELFKIGRAMLGKKRLPPLPVVAPPPVSKRDSRGEGGNWYRYRPEIVVAHVLGKDDAARLAFYDSMNRALILHRRGENPCADEMMDEMGIRGEEVHPAPAAVPPPETGGAEAPALPDNGGTASALDSVEAVLGKLQDKVVWNKGAVDDALLPELAVRFCGEPENERARRAYEAFCEQCGYDAFREELAVFIDECRAGEMPNNPGAALMKRVMGRTR